MRALSFCVLTGVMLSLANGCASETRNDSKFAAKAAQSQVAEEGTADGTMNMPDKGSTSKDAASDSFKPEKSPSSPGLPKPPTGPGAPGGGLGGLGGGFGGVGPGAPGDSVKGTPPAKDKAASDGKSRESGGSDALVASGPKGKSGWKTKSPTEPQSGRLTAGSFDDNLVPDAFSRFASKMGQDAAISNLTGKLFGRRLIVTAKGKDGNPLGNARVRISSSDNRNAVELISRSDGRVIFVESWDKVDGDLIVTVTPPDGSAPATQPVDRETSRIVVSLPAAAAPLPKNLDLVFVIDTTGSMGDELAYLKSEFKEIAKTIAAKFPNINQRYGLVVYRDRGDEYVVRHFDFTSSVDEFRKNLGAQSAAGGGDIPEAMEVGLEETAKLEWRSADTVRVMFLVADAPPHDKDIGRTMTAADVLRKKGIAIYPLACSGYDPPCELVMRSCAMLTGGQFLFLTDDSGVGEAHGEPHIPFYHVERQGRLMVRLVASELSGRRLEPTSEDIIRTVGNPPVTKGQ
jgi:von Willebrand factor type A domain